MAGISGLNIVSSDGEQFEFKTLDQLKDWTELEIEIWESFENTIEKFKNKIPGHNPNFHKYWSQIASDLKTHQTQPYKDLLVYIKSQPNQIEEAISSFNNETALVSESSKGVKLLELFEEEEELVSIFLLCIWNLNCAAFSYSLNINIPAIKSLYVAKQKAFIEAHLFDKGFKGTAKVEKKALQNVKNNANDMLADIAQKISESDKQIANNAAALESLDKKTISFFKAKQKFSKQLIKKQVTKLSDIEDIYTEKLSLQIPVTYWTKKASKHRTVAFIWGAAFLASIIILIIFAPSIFNETIKNIRIADENGNLIFDAASNPYLLLFSLTFPMFLAIWVLRIFSRMILTNFNHMHDSQNRAVMTETFLALMSENKASENDRILILNALFQPMNSSADDGAPPHWFELMMERMNKPEKL